MYRLILTVVTSAAFSLSPAQAPADGGGISLGVSLNIRTELEFRENVADHRVEDRSGNWNISYSNGRLRGEYDGLRLNARWQWRDRYWCRVGTLGGKKVNDCWSLRLDDDLLRVKPASGGRAMTYRLR